MIKNYKKNYKKVRRPGLDPGHTGLQPVALPTELSSHIKMELTWLEHATSCLQGRRSPN